MDGLTDVLRGTEALKEAVRQKDIEKAEKIDNRIREEEEKLDVKYILGDLDNLLRESRDGLERIKKIVADLKTFSRRDESAKSPADLNKILDGILNIVANEIKYKADVKKEYGRIPPFNCNSQQIGQVFINLLVNAVQAIKERGTIIIRTYAEKEKVFVEITDTGRGIPEGEIGKIFEPFYTTKKTGEGTGLGLSISYDIVKAHGGDIVVESEIGKGTKFTIIFPRDVS
ncbi:MAG: ATP-binding protein [Candidatus Omnitrophota bacterium]